MLSDYFLRWRNTQLLKNDHAVRKFVAYPEVKEVGVLFSDEFSGEAAVLSRFLERLQRDGKRVRTLTYFERAHSYPYEFKFDYFVKKDINFLGVINSDKVDQFIDFPFDYLFCLSTVPSLAFDHILLRSKARFRIGLYRPEGSDYLEVMVKSGRDQSVAELIDQMYTYTQQLLPNEP